MCVSHPTYVIVCFQFCTAKEVVEIFEKNDYSKHLQIIDIENSKFGTKYLKTYVHSVISKMVFPTPNLTSNFETYKNVVDNFLVSIQVSTYTDDKKLSPTFLQLSKFHVKLGVGEHNFRNYPMYVSFQIFGSKPVIFDFDDRQVF